MEEEKSSGPRMNLGCIIGALAVIFSFYMFGQIDPDKPITAKQFLWFIGGYGVLGIAAYIDSKL